MADIASLIEQEKPYILVEKDGRLRCTLNGHIMPPNKAAVESFLRGAKYKRLKERQELQNSFKKYEPFLIQSKNRPDKLYCALTCMLVGKTLASIRSHMKGKRFLSAKEKFEKDEQELMEEPDFESGSESEEEAERMEEDVMDGVQDLDLALGNDNLDDERNTNGNVGIDIQGEGAVEKKRSSKGRGKTRKVNQEDHIQEGLQVKSRRKILDLPASGNKKADGILEGNETSKGEIKLKRRPKKKSKMVDSQPSIAGILETQINKPSRQKRLRAGGSRPKKQKRTDD